MFVYGQYFDNLNQDQQMENKENFEVMYCFIVLCEYQSIYMRMCNDIYRYSHHHRKEVIKCWFMIQASIQPLIVPLSKSFSKLDKDCK